MQHIEKHLDARAFDQAAEHVRQWVFLEKFGEELHAVYDSLET